MKRLFISLLLVFGYLPAAIAQDAGAGGGIGAEIHLFDFPLNVKRLEGGITIGQAGSFSDYAHFGMGGSVLVGGVYVDFIHADPQHKYDTSVRDVKWNDTEAYSINAGYQIPILSWLRIMPLVGYAQTNDGVTDGSSLDWNAGDDSTSWYHRYTVTKGSRAHYFNYGGGISVQPCKWFSINVIATRHALYGGISFDILAFAGQ
ncbi:MAG: hypothetical protein J5640_02035 [Bacteroidales bacterium]|nr:hypothetical protein [Bacteroidales bacterium]